MWHDTRATRRLGLRYPIVQGPFGGGLSSPSLVACVSNAGGLGSFGAQGMAPERIVEVVEKIRDLTDAPFAMNLWVSTEDPAALTSSDSTYAAAIDAMAEFFEELDLEPPRLPLS